MATNIKTTDKSDARLAVITETMSRITSLNDHIARSTGDQQNMTSSISNHVDEIHSRNEETPENSKKLAQFAKRFEGIAKQFKV